MDLETVALLLKILAGVYVAVTGAAFLAQDKLIFQQQPRSERDALVAAAPNVEERSLTAADGTSLHAWLVRAAPGAPLVLYFGGNAENVSWMAAQARQQAPQTAWLLVDYRGYGSSGGAPSEGALVSDALAWYDDVVGATRPAQVYAFGRSLGSGVAVQLAAQRRLDGVILVTPFDSMVKVASHHYPYLPVGLLLRTRFDSISRAPEITTPLLCIAASADEVIPVEHARRLYEAWGGPKRWIEVDASHNTTDYHANYWPSIRAFLSSR